MRKTLANSRFNPAPGIADFWHEFRKPNPYRVPFLLVSMIPFGLIFLWLSGETLYKDPERPSITYITTFDPARTDADIVASNEANQEIKELREEQSEELAERKRELYKALGAAAGMDVEEIDQRGREARAAEEAERQAQLDEMMGRSDGETAAVDEGVDAPEASPENQASESSAP
ncbi:MAG: hypothetical protein AAFY42_00550 [Pseudomonadota bacterium]